VSRSDADYLAYIRESIERVERWTKSGRDAVFADEIVYEAVLRRLETLADAISHLSAPLKERHPEISWRAITDFRNRLAHGYLDVRPARVWDVIEVHLPLLKIVVLEEMEATEDG
jgi:uncharacterized protein with HEPN domain